jgi:hypothetical protein
LNDQRLAGPESLEDDPIARLVLTPERVTVGAGHRVQFTVVGLTASGDTAAIDVTWKAMKGTITDATEPRSRGQGKKKGHYRNGKTMGEDTVVVTDTSGVADTTEVTVTDVAVASVEVSPASAEIPQDGTVQLAATTRDSAGNELTDRQVLWSSNAPEVATVSDQGRVTGQSGGVATITATSEEQSGAASITVIPSAPPPPPPGPTVCGQSGAPVVTLTGSQGVFDRRSDLADNTLVDARAAWWLDAGNVPVRFGDGSGICLEGALIQGAYSNSTSWSTMHDTYAIQAYGPRPVLQSVRVHNYGDGTFFQTNADNWTIRGSWFSFIRDDCIQNDHLHNGLVEDVLFDGCYVFYSARTSGFSAGADGSNNLVVFRNVLARLQPMPTVYSGPAPGHGGFWKLDNDGVSPRIALENVVFRADQDSNHGHFMIPPASKLVQCNNVTLVWLGGGDYPEPVPACFTLTRDRAVWDDAVAAWHEAHPEVRNTLAVP